MLPCSRSHRKHRSVLTSIPRDQHYCTEELSHRRSEDATPDFYTTAVWLIDIGEIVAYGPAGVSDEEVALRGVIWNEHWASTIASPEIVLGGPSATSNWCRSKKCRYRQSRRNRGRQVPRLYWSVTALEG